MPFIQPRTFTITWINAAGGDWATASNWSGGALPGPTDNVGISTPQQQTITHESGNDTIKSLVVGNDLFVIYDSSLAITSGATFGYQLQIDGGDLYLGAGNATIGALAIYGDGSPFVTDGDLDGTGTVTVTGNALLGDGSGGVMTGAGTTLIDGNSTISAGIGGQPIGAFFGLDGGRVLQNAGTMTWSGGDIVLGFGSGGGTIENLASGTFDIAAASSMSAVAGITGLENAGLLEQTGITGQSDIGAPLTNTGSIAVDLGTLSLDDGGDSAADAISAANGATLAIGGGTFTVGTGGSLNVAGALAINQGLLELGAENATIGTYSQSSSTLDGTGTVTVTGTAALVGYAPTISGAGTLLLKGSTTVNGNVSLNAGRLLENAGTLTWIGDSFTLGSGYGGGTITNAAGAIFDIEVNSAIVSNVGPTVFNNAGLLEQQMTSGTTSLDVPFVNTGTVDILTGVLALNGGGTSNASAFAVAAGAELAFIDNGGPSVFTFTGGTLNIAGSTLIGDGELDASAAKVTSFGSTLTLNAISNGAGYNYPAYLELGSQSITLDNLVETNGTIDGSGNVTVTASTLFNGEAIQTGTGTTLLDGATTIDGNLALANDRTVDNAGTLTWTGGNVQLGLNPYATSIGGGNVVNAKGAVIDIENPVTMTVSGGNCAFTNNGLLEQTETTGETDLYAPFTNASTGTVSVLSGTLSFDGGGTSAAGAFHVAAGAALGFNLDENTTSTFTMTGGTYNVAGTTAISNGLLNLSAAKIASFGSLLYIGVSGAIELGGQSTTVKALEIDGPRYSPLAALYGTGTLTVSGNAIFNQSFVMTGTGTIMLDGQSTLTAGYSAFFLDGGYVLANAGTLSLYSTWDLVLGVTDGGGTIDNLAGGVIDIETAGEIDGNLGATQFLNAGTLVQASTVGGTTSVTTEFTNTGSVDVQAGFLSLDAGGSTSASALTVAAGATLGFGAADRTAATFTLTGGSLNIAGALQLGSGTLELGAQNQTAANYTQTGGDLDGSGLFTITGNSALVGGTFLQSGLGTTVIAGTGVLNSAYLYLDAGRTLDNSGQLTLEGGGQISLGINPFGSNVGGGTVINAAGATINIETNEPIINGTGATILRNAGLLEQTLATGQTSFDVPVSSTGTIDVQSGSMAFNGGDSSFSGLIDGAGQISFNASSIFQSLTIGGTAALTNTGSIAQTGLVTLGDSTGALASFTNEVGATYTIASSTLAMGKAATVFTDDGSLASTGNSAIDSALADNGSVFVTAGTLQVVGAASGNGTLSVASGALLDLKGGGSFAGAIGGAGAVAIMAAMTLDTGIVLTAAEVVDSASLTLASVAVTNTVGDIFAMSSASGAAVILKSLGTSSFTNAGSLVVSGTGTAQITTNFVNDGTVSVTSGIFLVTGEFSGNGALAIGSGARAYLSAGGALTEAIAGVGTLQLGAAYTLSAADLTVGTVQVNGPHVLSGTGTLAGAVIDSGTVEAAGGTLLIGGAVSGGGTLSAVAGAVLDLAGGGAFAGAVSAAGSVIIGGATTLEAGAKLAAAEVSETANVTLASVSVTNSAADTYAIGASSGATVTLGSSGTGAFTNAGSLAANGAGTADISASFTNSGTVSALGGTLSFLSSVGGTGTVDLGASGTLAFAQGAGSGQAVDFLGTTGVLDLAKPLEFAGTITGFGNSDQIFLENTTFTTFGFANDVLTVSGSSGIVASLHITESSNLFVLNNENHGVLITFS